MTEARRSRLEIYAEILDKARRPQRKTGLVYDVNSNFQWLSDALEVLVGAGLIVQVGSGYTTTQAGLAWLKMYKQVMEAVQL